MEERIINHFRHGSLFSGIGGFDLAAEWMGWENIFHCEWMPFPRKVLNHYWPNSISYEDITKTDFSIHRGTIDILTGGFPCQPYSAAGKRLGKEDERHLWPHMLRAIREIEPTFVVGENVRGLTNWNGGVVFEEVCSDLEACGYEVQPLLLPACAIGAPHRRDRVWFVAYSKNSRHYKKLRKECSDGEWELLQNKSGRSEMGSEIERCSREWPTSDSNSWRLERSEEIGWNSINAEWEGKFRTSSDSDGSEQTNNEGTNRTEADQIWRQNESDVLGELCSDGMASDSDGIGRNKTFRKSKRESNVNDKNSIRNDWQNFPTQSPICGGDDGIPNQLDGITFPNWRKESIKGYGNAIVPQLAYQIFKSIQYLNDNENQNQL
jgi:DNA (cytosine-5)-methyltransferase 1